MRIRYFYSDYESSLYNSGLFFSFFKAFCEKADLSALMVRPSSDGMKFKDWKNVKRHLLPFKVFNKSLIEKVSAQKFYSSDVSQNIPNVI